MRSTDAERSALYRAAELVSRPSPLINKFQDTLGSVIASLAL